MKYVVEIDIIRAQLRSYVLYQVLLFANYGLWYKDVFWDKVFWEKLKLIRLSWVMILIEESMSLWISPLLFTNLGRAGSIYDPQSSDKSISGDTPPTLVSCLESTQPFAWQDMPSTVFSINKILFFPFFMEIGYCVGPSRRYILLKGEVLKKKNNWATLGL